MTDFLKAILIDDEASSLQNLSQKLEEYCPQVTVVASLQNPEEAIPIIRQNNPDVIFLDIKMPRISGFCLLEQMGDYEAAIIFTTAYNQFAIDAIRVSAFDYLEKPLSITDLQNAVARLIRQPPQHTQERLAVLQQTMRAEKPKDNKIAIPTNTGLEFVTIKDILRIESSSNYSRLHLAGGQNLLVTKLLKDFEEILMPHGFFRVHKSHLINLGYIRKYIRGDGGQIVMENGDLIDVARRKKEEFLSLINK
jgi:two-component system, LytTR family, response regulator